MMEPVLRVDGSKSDPCKGEVIFDAKKSSWNLGVITIAILCAPFTFSFPAFIVFLLLTYFSLLIGHSAGMHRMMIHRSYRCNKAVERLLIYIGVLVGMSGPYGIIKIHDLRDWAQRQPKCHDFFSHKRGYVQDIWWQLTSVFSFESPPKVTIEAKYADDPFYRFLERTWHFHQVLLAVPLYLIGGWSFVVWGIFVRISISIIGHWTVTYICHNPGPGKWRVEGAAVQASNLPGLGVLTYGECWHNNHHAFPESARIGLEKGQHDPTWYFISLLQRLGYAHDVGLPREQSQRDDIYKID